MQNKKIISILTFLLIVGLLVFVFQKIRYKTPSIDSFEECAAAGNPVMESYPMRCRTADGQEFVQDISQIPDAPIVTPTTTEEIATITASSSEILDSGTSSLR